MTCPIFRGEDFRAPLAFARENSQWLRDGQFSTPPWAWLRWFTFEMRVFWIIFGVIKFYVHYSSPLQSKSRIQRGTKCEMDVDRCMRPSESSSERLFRGNHQLTSFYLEINAKRFLIRRKLDENVCQLEMCVRFHQPFHPHHGKCNFVSDRSRETAKRQLEQRQSVWLEKFWVFALSVSVVMTISVETNWNRCFEGWE